MELIALLAGILVGAFYFGVAYLPLFYGLPRSIAWAARGWITWTPVFLYLAFPVAWLFAYAAALVAGWRTMPDFAYLLLRSDAALLGHLIGAVVFGLGRTIISPPLRNDVRKDFSERTLRYMTPAGIQALGRGKT